MSGHFGEIYAEEAGRRFRLKSPESSLAVEQLAELMRRGFYPKTVGADKGSRQSVCHRGMRERRSATSGQKRRTEYVARPANGAPH
jgi:hypothetical protein